MAEHGAHELTRVPTDIHDEAGETPMWVPILGLCVVGLIALALALSAAIGPEAPADAPAAAAALAIDG
jgi:hypothetical protein